MAADPNPIEALADGVRKADLRALARACRLIDERDPRWMDLLKRLAGDGGGAYVLGITGTPGAGKSTLVDGLIQRYRAQGKRVGVLAVDPTSPFSGGAILGDRIRMQQHFLDESVFIRSTATRGTLGGLSRSTGDVIRVLDAAGFDVVIVETVGVGQDELEVARFADTTVVVMAPGLGDDVQAIKAGILEIADVFAVNKADRAGADTTVVDLQQMIALGRVSGTAKAGPGHSAAAAFRREPTAGEGQWVPPIVKTIASRAEGLDELITSCSQHREFLASSDAGSQLVADRRVAEFHSILHHALLDGVRAKFEARIESCASEVHSGAVDPYSAAESVVDEVLGRRMI